MKIIALFVLMSLNTSAQFLSLSKNAITTLLSDQHVSYVTGDVDGLFFISAQNVSGCVCIFGFDANNICKKEVIIAAHNTAVIDLIMDLNDKHYIKVAETSWHEEPYGLVEVKRYNDTYTYTYD